MTFFMPAEESSWRRSWRLPAGQDAQSLSEAALHYDLFFVRIVLKVDDKYFIGPNAYVPLFDFLCVVSIAIKELNLGQATTITFPENSREIRIRPRGQQLEIDALDRGVAASLSRERFMEALLRLHESGTKILSQEVPGITENPFMSKIYLD